MIYLCCTSNQWVLAAEAGHRALFMTLDRLVSTLVRARQQNRLDRQLQQLTYPKVLMLDEGVGLTIPRGTSLFLRLINRRYDRASPCRRRLWAEAKCSAIKSLPQP